MGFTKLANTTSVLLILFGIPLLIAPSTVTNLFAMPDSNLFNELVAIMARLYGALITCCGIALLIARDSGPSKARTAITFLIASGTATTMIVHLYGVITGLENVVGLLIAAALGFLSAWATLIISQREKY